MRAKCRFGVSLFVFDESMHALRRTSAACSSDRTPVLDVRKRPTNRCVSIPNDFSRRLSPAPDFESFEVNLRVQRLPAQDTKVKIIEVSCPDIRPERRGSNFNWAARLKCFYAGSISCRHFPEFGLASGIERLVTTCVSSVPSGVFSPVIKV